MNVEIETEAVQFPEKKYINEMFVAVWSLSCKSSRKNLKNFALVPVCAVCTVSAERGTWSNIIIIRIPHNLPLTPLAIKAGPLPLNREKKD
jgi:hypothetical protein